MRKAMDVGEPLTVSLGDRDGIWTMESEELGIIAMGADYEDCLKDFNDEFLFVWDAYGSADKAALTAGARELKRKIGSIVKGPPTEQ